MPGGWSTNAAIAAVEEVVVAYFATSTVYGGLPDYAKDVRAKGAITSAIVAKVTALVSMTCNRTAIPRDFVM
jgi:hypothetical protein